MSDDFFYEQTKKISDSLAEIGRRHNEWIEATIKRINAALTKDLDADGDQYDRFADIPVSPDEQQETVTLTEATPPIMWRFPDKGPWQPERLTFNGAEYVLAEPPKADPADTFEQYQRELRHTQQIEDRAAKRGREYTDQKIDEAVELIVKMLRAQGDRETGSDRIDRNLIGSALYGIAYGIDDERAQAEATGHDGEDVTDE